MAPMKQEGSTRCWKYPMRGMRSAWWLSFPGRRFPWPHWNPWSRPPWLMNGLILWKSKKWKCICQGENILSCHWKGELLQIDGGKTWTALGVMQQPQEQGWVMVIAKLPHQGCIHPGWCSEQCRTHYGGVPLRQEPQKYWKAELANVSLRC